MLQMELVQWKDKSCVVSCCNNQPWICTDQQSWTPQPHADICSPYIAHTQPTCSPQLPKLHTAICSPYTTHLQPTTPQATYRNMQPTHSPLADHNSHNHMQIYATHTQPICNPQFPKLHAHPHLTTMQPHPTFSSPMASTHTHITTCSLTPHHLTTHPHNFTSTMQPWPFKKPTQLTMQPYLITTYSHSPHSSPCNCTSLSCTHKAHTTHQAAIMNTHIHRHCQLIPLTMPTHHPLNII